MKKTVFAILACTLVVAFAGCGIENNGGAVSSGGNGSEQIVETYITEEQDVSAIQESSSEVSELNENTEDISTDKAKNNGRYKAGKKDINLVWYKIYYWAMGSDYVYIDSDGYIYEESEMEEPLFEPLGACEETYTGEQFTEEELNEFLEIYKDDEEGQKEMLRKKGLRFGK